MAFSQAAGDPEIRSLSTGEQLPVRVTLITASVCLSKHAAQPYLDGYLARVRYSWTAANDSGLPIDASARTALTRTPES